MALTNAELNHAWHEMLARQPLPPTGCRKPDMLAAATAVDAWCTTNQASYIAALPEPFKTNSTNAEKSQLLAYICMKRGGVF
jgi:hypothetical protein